MIEAGRLACVRCGADMAGGSILSAGGFTLHDRLGFSFDGALLPMSRGQRGLLGGLMVARGRTLSTRQLASAFGYEGDGHDSLVKVMVCAIRRILREAGAPGLVGTVRAQGFAWTGGPVRSRPAEESPSMCSDCGMNVERETPVSDGVFSHDPDGDVVAVAGVRLHAPLMIRRLLGTLLRMPVAGMDYEVLADRIGIESESPYRCVKVHLSRMRRICEGRGVTLPVQSIHGRGVRWVRSDSPEAASWHFAALAPASGVRAPVAVDVRPEVRRRGPFGRHACGCAVDGPLVWSGRWSWSIGTGLRIGDEAMPVDPRVSMLVALVMAGSGRVAPPRRSSWRAAPGSGPSVDSAAVVAQAERWADGLGETLPIRVVGDGGHVWTGLSASVELPDASLPCPACAAAVAHLGVRAVRRLAAGRIPAPRDHRAAPRVPARADARPTAIAAPRR